MEERRDKFPRKEKKDIIFGIHPVIEAIKSDQELNKILIQKGIEKDHFRELKESLAGKDFNIQYVPVQKLNRHLQQLTKNLKKPILQLIIQNKNHSNFSLQ